MLIQMYPIPLYTFKLALDCIQKVNNNIYMSMLDTVICQLNCIQQKNKQIHTMELASKCIKNSQTQAQTQTQTDLLERHEFVLFWMELSRLLYHFIICKCQSRAFF